MLRIRMCDRALLGKAMLWGSLCLAGTPGIAQTIEPVIVEYTEKADGRFEVRNDTLTPMAIVLEPRSFSIAADGRGIFRALDAGIHIALSTNSFRLEPRQSYYVFYKASADVLPAWFTVYATFSPVRAGPGMTVRVMLPHTVYLYQKRPLNKGTIHLSQAMYAAGKETGKTTVTCDVENTGLALVRVQEVRAVAGKTSVVLPGFPLLPSSTRHLEINWEGKGRPEYVLLHFPHFDMKEPLAPRDQ